MTPSSIIDLILSVGLLTHVMYCFMWSRKNLGTIYKVLLLPNRNFLAKRALMSCLPILVILAGMHAVLLWRFYMLLGSFNAWGASANVFIILTSLIALHRLWHKVYFERLITEANASGYTK